MSFNEKRTHTCGELRETDVGKRVTLMGWIDSLRDHGAILFVNLRDRYGITQIVIKDAELKAKIRKFGHETVISAKGEVIRRPKGMENPELSTGKIDVAATEISLISKSKVPPFVITDEVKAKDELRLKYRYLDLRRRPMQEAIIFRSQATQVVRNYLNSLGFLDIETPILAKSTPEGARDFLVPSRVHPGKFYALAQSPQLYKQVLMVAGFDRYYQLAKCFRDEDQRGDRQPEHTQIDIEMSFVTEEDVFEVVEGLMKELFKKTLDAEIKTPFKQITFKEAMENYGIDKPDTRFELLIKDVTDIAKKGAYRIFNDAPMIKSLVWDGTLTRKELDEVEKIVKSYGGKGISWMKFENENFTGGISKFFNQKVLQELKEKLQVKSPSTILFTAGGWKDSLSALGGVRVNFIEKLTPSRKFEFVWVRDFPLLEYSEEEQNWIPSHHIFTMPKEPASIDTDPSSSIAKHYDLVLNGTELGSGSIRIHIRELQEKVMKIIGLSDKEIEEQFGFLLDALEYGAPPHGGIALGFERILTIMKGMKNIQEVIPFPKTLTGTGLLEDIPSEIDQDRLKELNVKLDLDKF
jgi:aspartyl-tRNA synthetase